MKSAPSFSLVVEGASGSCAVGEHRGNQCRAEGRIPVISCEGACIRGEIARLAANLVAKEEPYRRSCHGEMFTVPASSIAEWMREAQKVVVIDGCFLHCHGRILKNLVAEEKIVQFDALAVYQKYTDRFDIDEVEAIAEIKADEDIRTGELKPSTEQRLIRDEMNGCIREIIQTLPEQYKSIIVLSELEDLKDGEIAEILGFTLQAAKVRLHRARARLRKELAAACVFYRDERNEFACDRKNPSCE